MKYANIALRNLGRQKKRSLLLGLAIAFGFMIITIVLSLTAGAAKNTKDNIVQLAAGHIFVSQEIKRESGKIVDRMDSDEEVLLAIEAAEIPVTKITYRSVARTTLIFNSQEKRQMVTGVDWNFEADLRDQLLLLEGSVEDTINTRNGFILAESVVKDLNLSLGDELLVRNKTATGQENVGELILTGIMADSSFFPGIYSYANKAYLNELLNLPEDAFQSISISIPDLGDTDMYTNKLYAELSKLAQVADLPDIIADMTESGEKNRMTDVIFMMETDDAEWDGQRYEINSISQFTLLIDIAAGTINFIGFVILVILFVIIGVGIVNTFRMVMYERTREIGTMRAVGMQKGIVRRLFLYEAIFLGFGGALAGFILGNIATAIASLWYFGANHPLGLFLKNGHLEFINDSGVIGALVLVVIITLISAAFPASKAAKKNPADALRSI